MKRRVVIAYGNLRSEEVDVFPLEIDSGLYANNLYI